MRRLSGLPCLLHLLWLFASISFQHCNAVDTISVTEPLQDPNFLVSSGQIFKSGIFSPQNTTNRHFGIMFNVPKMEAVWVANRDKPLHDSSGVLTISEDGNLVILNGKKEILWSSNAPNPAPNSTAQLLENGNLVLRDGSNGRSVWQSFEHPTDSFLVGMRIGGSGNGTIQLTSWRSPSDPSTGSITFGLNSTRIPEMYLLNRGVLFWRSGPWDGRAFIGSPSRRSPVFGSRPNVITDSSGETYVTYENRNATNLSHFKINESGKIQELAINEEGEWVLAYQSNRTECDVYGKCGHNGICDHLKGSQMCTCLRGFKPRNTDEWTSGNWSGGCLRKALQQCDRSNNSAGKQIEGNVYLKFTNVKLPDFYNFIPTSEEECGNECLKNCTCSAYAYVEGIGCLQWPDNMIDIQQFSMLGSDLYLRVANSELDTDNARSNKRKKTIVSIAVSAGFLLLATSLFIFWNRWNKRRGRKFKTESSEKSKLEELQLYTYHTLANATNHFHDSNKLGQGGFGPVYKGQLLNGQEIAVKRLSNSSSQGMKEFMNEVTLISKLQHCSLVRLLGSCVERAEKMLVYEYLPNKSLDTYLFDSGKQDLLDWNRRYSIIEGISRGLLYLHRDSRLRIIHRDLKASNILLDEELNPKISDFGLARIFGGKQDQANTNRVVGTYGYMAPEYALGGKFSEKSDVYSFGVLLLEIVSGKRNTSFYRDEENLSLLGYAWKLWNENEAVNLAFTEIVDPMIEMEVRRFAQVGLLCVQDNPNDRPNMSNVLSMLNSEIVDLPLPKLPVYTCTFLVSENHDNPQSRPSNNGITLTELQAR